MNWTRLINLLIWTGLVKWIFQFTWTETFWILVGFGLVLFVLYAIADLFKFIVRSVQEPTVHYHFHQEHYEERRVVELHPDFTRPYSARVPKPKELEKGKNA